MPYAIHKVKNSRYEVYNPVTGVVHAKHTTLKEATAQIRILSQLEKSTKTRN